LWEARLRRKAEIGRLYFGFIEVGQTFARAVRDELRRRRNLSSGTVFFSYDTAALETLEWCREHGILCILDQMDPSRVEVDLVHEEEKRWPGWIATTTQVPEEYFRRREQEWLLADRVVVNSKFSWNALIRQGVPIEKLVVIPLCYESKSGNWKGKDRNQFRSSAFQFSSSCPLKVLFLGQVILRKGIQYLVEAAKLLHAEPVHFDVVGPIDISEEAVKSAPANLTFHGRANRDDAGGWYERADVFVLPTLSDGFALTQLEAMAHGLPAIATPNCGEVVTHEVDGFIVPPQDAAALARCIQRYLAEPEIVKSQSVAALKKSKQFSMGRLNERLLTLEADLCRCQS
jgi:glycosyltransferase involved in cell wall biosynthesis